MDGDDWTGGLPADLDMMFPARPEDPEMRESASLWLFEENGAFALPRNGVEAVGAMWDNHRFDCNFAFADGRALRESMRGPTLPAIGPAGRVQDYRAEKLAGMSERERADAGSMGYGYRIEQLFRARGTLTVDGETREFTGLGSRIHRQSVRPMAAFRGHCWQSAVFPDGRAFSYIAYPLREGESEEDRHNIGYVWQDGVMHPAKARDIPFLRRIMPRGDDVSVVLDYAGGTLRVGGTTELCTFHLGNPGTNGFHNQQSGVRYTLDGMSAFGMVERSSPADLCTIVAEEGAA